MKNYLALELDYFRTCPVLKCKTITHFPHSAAPPTFFVKNYFGIRVGSFSHFPPLPSAKQSLIFHIALRHPRFREKLTGIRVVSFSHLHPFLSAKPSLIFHRASLHPHFSWKTTWILELGHFRTFPRSQVQNHHSFFIWHCFTHIFREKVCLGLELDFALSPVLGCKTITHRSQHCFTHIFGKNCTCPVLKCKTITHFSHSTASATFFGENYLELELNHFHTCSVLKC